MKLTELHSDGDGQPVLLLGGQFMPRSRLQPVVEDLSRYARVLTVDLPNFPEAPSMPEVDSMGSYARCLRRLLEEAGIPCGQVIGFGISFGAELLRAMDLLEGVRFKELILGSLRPLAGRKHDPGALPRHLGALESGQSRHYWQAYFNRLAGKADPPTAAGRPLVDTLTLWYDSRVPSLRSLLRATCLLPLEFEGVKERYRCRITLLAGTRDRPVRDGAEHHAESIGAALQVIDSGHLLLTDNPEATLAAVHRVLDPHLQEA